MKTKGHFYAPLLAIFTVMACFEANALSSAGQPSVADVKLEEIIVTATRLPRRVFDIAGTISVISERELAVQVANDLDDIVRYQPGISMNTASRGGNQGFIIRGIGGNRVLTLIDGVRSNDIYAAGPSSYGRDSFEVDDLKAVEVIHGPASVLYGADALGGVVLLQSKSAGDYLRNGDEFYSDLRFGFDNASDEYKVGATLATQRDKLGILLRYTRRQFEEKDVEGSVHPNPQDGQSDALLAKADWQVNREHAVALTFDGVKESIDSVLNSDLGRSVSRSLGDDKTERYRLSLAHTWLLGAAFADYVKTDVHWQKTDALQYTMQQRTSFSFPYAPVGTAARRDSSFEFNQRVAGAQAQLVKSFRTASVAHALVYGLNFDQTETERPRNRCETDVATGSVTCAILAFPFSGAEVFPNKTFPDTKTKRAGIYVQDELTLGDTGFTVIPGLRYDDYKMTPDLAGVVQIAGFVPSTVSETNVSASLGATYDISDNINVFAQYSQGFRPPNFDESNQSFVNRNFNYATVANPDLEPETSDGFELGVKGHYQQIMFSAAVFDNRYDDFIDTQFVGMDGNISLFQDVNIGEARIYGVEASALWQIAPEWRLRGSVSWAKGDDEVAKVPLDSVEPLTGVMSIAYDASNDLWGAQAVITAADRKDRVSSDDAITSGGYGVMDVFAYYRVARRFTLRAAVMNVFNRRYARWANLAGLEASSEIGNRREPGAQLRVSVQFEL